VRHFEPVERILPDAGEWRRMSPRRLYAAGHGHTLIHGTQSATYFMLLELLRIAGAALRANPLRSLLTMLGIVIGVAAVIAMVALGDGAQHSVEERIARLGTTTLQIDATWIRSAGVQLNTRRRLSMDDAHAIEERAPHVLAVQPQQDRMLQIQWGDRNANIRIIGASPNFLVVRNYEIDRGRMFNSAENRGMQRVAVLGAGALTQLDVIDPSDIIGQRVRIGGVPFTVIGTLRAKGAGGGFGSPDDQVVIPFYTGRYRVFKTDWVNDIYALASSEADLPAAMAEIRLAMRHSQRLRPDQPDDFRIRNQADFLETLDDTTSTFTALLAGIAGVSLLVGGIGIMNIMLVSVTERTREIGIRMAIGARGSDVLTQFLVESIVMSVLGGLVGLAAGFGGAALLGHITGWTTATPASAVLLAVGFSAVVGVFFGWYPARKAAALDPIQALRYE
jgi:putative ABC transport system permease protein